MSGARTVAPLTEVADLNPSLPKKPSGDEEVSFVSMAGVSAETASVEIEETRVCREVTKGYTPFLPGDVLLAKITPCFENGKIAQANISRTVGFGSTEFHVVRPRPDRLDARFLLHFLRQERIRKAGERRMTGSGGQRRVPEHFLSGLQLPLPPLVEQRRIGEVLDRAEALRAKRRAALAQLDSLTQSLFLDLFGDPVANPQQWRRTQFGQILERIDSGWSPTCLNRPAIENEWGVLKLGAVTWCEFDPTENKALPSDEEPDPSIEVKAGDLLFTRKNTYELVAACALVRETPPRLMMSDLIFRLKLKADANIDQTYLHQLLIYPTKRRELQTLAGGSSGSMPNISKARLAAAEIEIPPIGLQREFARRVASVEKLKTAHRAALAELDALFTSLQHRAFRGEL